VRAPRDAGRVPPADVREIFLEEPVTRGEEAAWMHKSPPPSQGTGSQALDAELLLDDHLGFQTIARLRDRSRRSRYTDSSPDNRRLMTRRTCC
jgi:hypothetical protein